MSELHRELLKALIREKLGITPCQWPPKDDFTRRRAVANLMKVESKLRREREERQQSQVEEVKPSIRGSSAGNTRGRVYEDEFTPYRVRKDLERMWRESDEAYERVGRAPPHTSAGERERWVKKFTTDERRKLTRLRRSLQCPVGPMDGQPTAQIVQFPLKRVAAAGSREPIETLVDSMEEPRNERLSKSQESTDALLRKICERAGLPLDN